MINSLLLSFMTSLIPLPQPLQCWSCLWFSFMSKKPDWGLWYEEQCNSHEYIEYWRHRGHISPGQFYSEAVAEENSKSTQKGMKGQEQSSPLHWTANILLDIQEQCEGNNNFLPILCNTKGHIWRSHAAAQSTDESAHNEQGQVWWGSNGDPAQHIHQAGHLHHPLGATSHCQVTSHQAAQNMANINNTG